MQRFWEQFLLPVARGCEAEVICEVGSLQGGLTEKLLDFCLETGAVAHVIDPAPGFDVAEWEQRYGSALVFHRALSLDALAEIPCPGLVFIDGDHNWFTVINELRLLERRAAEEGRPAPVIAMHDIGWPYARRDLYYDPETIPAEHRQPFARLGTRPDDPALVEEAGLNSHLDNALAEGGPRNGVLTAIEDFLAESGQDWLFKVVPGFHSVGLLATTERLEREPALMEAIELWDEPSALRAQIEAVEAARIDAELLRVSREHQRALAQREATASDRERRRLEESSERALAEHKAEKRALEQSSRDLEREAAKLRDTVRDQAREIEEARAEAAAQRWARRRLEQGRGNELERVRKDLVKIGQSRTWRYGQGISRAFRRFRRRSAAPPRDPVEALIAYIDAEDEGAGQVGARRRLHGARAVVAWLSKPSKARLRLAKAYFTLRRSGAFDSEFYLAAHPRVEALGADPLAHYLEHGWREGLDPSPHFSTSGYLARRPDVARAGINPLLHYVLYGGDPSPRTGSPPARSTAAGRPPRLKVSVLCWEMGHNPLGRAYLLAEALARSFDVEIVGSQFPRYGDDIWAPLRAGELPMRAFPGTDFPDHLRTMERMARAIKGDVLVVSKPRLPSLELGILAKEAFNRPMILDVDDRELSFFAESTGLSLREAESLRADPDFLLPFGRIWTRHCETLIEGADAVTVSNDRLADLYGGTVIPHGRDERLFDPALYDREDVRARFGFGPSDRVVLFVGTPRAHKGVLDLIEAVEAIPDPHYKLCVIGTVRDRPVAERLERLGDRAVAVGDRPLAELPENMMVGDLVCLLQDPDSEISRYQMPAKLTDALAMAVPVLANPVPPLREPIARGLVEPVGSEPLADQIVRSFERLDQLRAKASENREVFVREFSHAALDRRLSELVEDLGRRPVPFPAQFADTLAFHRSHFGERPKRVAGRRAAGRAIPNGSHPAPSRQPVRRRLPRPRSRAEDGDLDIVFFWKQNDSGIYGRRSDMMVKYLAASPRVRQVVHLDRPIDEATVSRQRQRGGTDPTDHGALIYHNILRRARPGRRRGKVKEHVFVYAGPRRSDRRGRSPLGGLARRRSLPPREAYVDYVAELLEGYGVGERTTVFWDCPVDYSFPQLSRLLDADLTVADVIDDRREFLEPGAPERSHASQNYRDVLAASDLVLANAAPVRDAMLEYVDEVHLIPNASEPAQDRGRGAPPREILALGRPVIGYVGNLDPKRIDIDLLDHLARARPAWRLVFIGSTHMSRDLTRLAEYPNVHFLGVRPYEEVRRYVAALDVAILPHADNPLTQSMNPLKLFVYASAGVPIVSTDVANIDELRALVRVAPDADSFVAAIEQALEGGRGLTPAGRELLARHSWPERVTRVLDLIDGKLSQPREPLLKVR